MDFLSSEADIVIGGAGAGVGKSFALLMEASRNVGLPLFNAMIFRRTMPMVKNPGGLWDESINIYQPTGLAKPSAGIAEWNWSSGAKIKFSHLQHEKDIYAHQGAQYALIGFDELTHFTKKQFLYLLTRNRSVCGIKPYVRATCNPDPDSFVLELIQWWIDEDGWVIPEKLGKIRYFTIFNNEYVWGDTVQEVVDKCPELFNDPLISENVEIEDVVKSLAFLPGKITDNKELLNKNPAYLANLMAQPDEVRNQLLYGNWKAVQDNLALCNFKKVNDIFSNPIKRSSENKRYITVDVARQGRDLAVIMVWNGWEVVELSIFTTVEKLSELNDDIERLREKWNIGASNVIVDADGMGYGVTDYSQGYQEFHATKSAVNPIYADIKTECHYRTCIDHVNTGNIRFNVSMETCRVDGINAIEVKVRGRIYDIKALIKKQFRTIKRKDENSLHQKKKIKGKDDQKTMLQGMSPDFTDCATLRMIPELSAYGLFYNEFEPNRHLSAAISYSPKEPLHLAFKSNSEYHVNLVVFQTFQTKSGKTQINCIKDFALKSPSNTVGKLCDSFMSWVMEEGIYSSAKKNGVLFYSRPLGNGDKFNKSHIQNVSSIRNGLKTAFNQKSSALMDYREDSDYKTFSNEILKDEDFLLRIHPLNCENLTRDLMRVQENKEGGKQRISEQNTSNPSDAFFNNALSVLFKKYFYSLRK